MSSTRSARRIAALVVAAASSACGDAGTPTALTPGDGLPPIETLGERIFHDPDLSLRKNQSCASCHDEAWGFRGSAAPSRAGVFQGSVPGRFGGRAPLSAAYGSLAPVFRFSAEAGGYVGGNFWDGRATGARLGSPAAEQALGPFVNPAEQGLPDIACVVYRVSRSAYGGLYREVWGREVDAIAFPSDTDARCGVEGGPLPLSAADRRQVQAEYDRIGRSIAAFEASSRVSAFTSKFDAWLRGEATLTQQEHMGMMLFQGRGRCSNCHTIAGPKPLFTDFTYHNVGTPPDPEAPAAAPADLGLGGPGGAAPGAPRWGQVRTPTLRNVDRRPTPSAPRRFMHNGAFRSLEEVVRYYNTRDVLPTCPPSAPRTAWGDSCWPAPSVRDNLNTVDMGNLQLSSFQEAALVAFLRTLSDGYRP